MKNISIKKILLIYTFIIFFVPILIIGIGSLFLTTLHLKDQIKSSCDSFLNVIEKDLKYFIRERETNLFFVASLYKKYKINEFWEFYIEKDFIDDGNFDTIFILNNKGIITNIFPTKMNHLIGLDYSNESVIKKVITENEMSISLIRYSFFNEKPSLLIAIPVFDSRDQLIAIVAGIIKFSKLKNNLLELKKCCANMEFIITDKSGTVLMHPDKQKMEQIETLDYLSKLKENVINFIQIENNFYFIKYKVIKKTEWLLLVLQDYNFVVSLFYKIFVLFFINILVGIIFAIISVIFGTYLISKPIYSLSYQTSQVSHTTNYNIKREEYFITELNSLSINLNKMIKRIAKREEELRISEAKYRKLIENSADFFFKVDKDINFTFISSSVENLLGYSAEEFKNNFRNIITKNRMNIESRRKIKDLFKTKIIPEPFNLELKHKKDDVPVVLELQVTPIPENDKIVEVQGVARDVTSRFYAQKEVIYLKNYLLNLIESIPSGLITLDKDGKVTNLNSNAVNIINKPKEEIIEKKLWEIDKRFVRYLSYFNYVLEKYKAVDIIEEIIIDRKEKFFNITFFPMKWENSLIIGLRIDDVTEIEKTERQLQEIQKLETIGTIASGLSHDFNNILGAILGTLRVIEERTKNKKAINCSLLNNDLDVIKDASKKATYIVQQLMNFSRRQSIKFDIIELNNEVKNVINIFKKSLINKKNINIILKENKENIWIEGNSTLIEQMLLNLLLNARDAIEETGTITITLTKVKYENIKEIIKDSSNKNDFVCISISDTGKGIPDSIKSNIFSPLFTTKEKGKGTGLGLSMAYNIVKNHKGYITFDSIVNHGTTFYIYLPYVDINNYNKEKYEIKGEQKIGIMVVDDDLYIRQTTEQILKECGYKVFLAASGEECIKILKEKASEIKVIILDVIMPGLHGKELVREIFKYGKNYQILLMSGTRNEITIFELENMGIKDFLLKPFTFEELGEAIYKLLNKV